MRRRHGLAAALLVLLLAGCTSIPTRSGVIPGPTQAPDDPRLIVVPPLPESGADPRTIVDGFVQAAIEGGAYGIARRYLTPEFAKRWRPEAGVLVYQTSWTTRSTGQRSVVVTVPVSGRLDANGVYSPDDGEVPLPFSLQKVGGQWRIASAPNGIVLAQDSFQRAFQRQDLQLLDPTFTRFVPDLRWLPNRDSQTAPLVRALVTGPSPTLASGAVPRVFPEGTRVRRVTAAAGGAVVVALDVPGDPPSTAALQHMGQELSRTLGPQFSVRLLVNGRPAPSAGAPVPTPLGQQAFGLAGGRFGPITANGVTDDPALGKAVAATRPTAITVAPRQRLAVVTTTTGVAVVTAGTTRFVDRRGGLADATLDQRGWVYSVPRDESGPLVSRSAKGAAAPLSVRLGGLEVRSIEVSPDGTRLLLLLRGAGRPVAYVVGIERNADGAPTGLSSSRSIVALTADDATDATWLDDAQVAVLVNDGDTQSVVTQPVGGLPSSLGPLPSAASAIVGVTDLRALTVDGGDVYIRPNDLWQREFDKPVRVQVLAVQR